MIDLKFLRWENIKEWKNEEVSSFVDNIYNDTKSWMLKIHRDWYLNERFARWDHWVYYNKTLWKIDKIPVEQWEIRRTVNKVKSQIRGVKNFIKRNQPRWQTSPSDWTDESLKEAITSNKILQHYYDTLNFRSLLTDIIVSSLKTSVWILQVWVSENKWEIDIDAFPMNPFEVMFDPTSQDYRKWRFIALSYPMPISTIKEKYSKVIWKDSNTDVSWDSIESESEFWSLLEKERKWTSDSSSSKEMATSIVKELWIRWSEWWNTKIRRITTWKGYILDVYDTKYKRFPIFVYNPEKAFNSPYSEPWIKDLISLNKSLDKTVSAIESYIHRMLGGKYLIKKWVEVSTITDKGAEKIYYKGNVPPIQMQLQPLPYTPIQYSNSTEQWIEELWWVREASLGRAPWSLQSWKWVEALQASDAATVSEPVENLEDFLREVGEFILDIVSEYSITSKEINVWWEAVKFTWKEWANIDWVIKINRKTNVKVVIVPEIAHSEDAKFERMMQMVQLWILDPQTVLEKLEVSNIADVMERVKYIQQQKMQDEMLKQKASHSKWEWIEDYADLADNENQSMSMWKQIPETPDSMLTQDHTNLHLAFIKEFQQDYMQNQELFDQHIMSEENRLAKWVQPWVNAWTWAIWAHAMWQIKL